VKDYLHYLTPFARHRFLNNDQLTKLSGRSFDTTERAIHVLKSEPNFLLKLCDEQNRNRRFYQNSKAYYELSPKGEKELRDRGVPIIAQNSSRSFDHEVMTNEISSSFDIGARETGTEIWWWNDLTDKLNPGATASVPLDVPSSRDAKKVKPTYFHPDYPPLVINRKFFLHGFQTDCDSEDLDPKTQKGSSIRHHFERSIDIMRRGIFRTHFGTETFYVPFVTTFEGRMRNMIALLQSIDAKDCERFFLFKWMPTFKLGTPAPVTGHMLTEPWLRGDGRQFSFLK
jgi:hypothetical protein